MEGQIPREVMDERLQRLQARLSEHSLAFNRANVGADTRILIERKGRRDGQMIGKSPWLQSVHVETGARLGDMLDVTLVAAGAQQPDRRRPPEGSRLMARRDLAAVADDGRARLELEFEQPYLLGPLFGDYDRHLITIEQRLGVHIAARGNKRPDRGRGRCGGARARRPDRALQPARPRPRRRCRGGRGGARHGRPAAPRRDHRGGGHLGAQGDDPHAQEDHRPALDRADRRTWRRSARDDMIFALGPAGTGKTYLAVAQAVSQLISGSVDRLILSRPAVEAGERLGFLPGDMKEKVDPYLRPLYDALYDMLPTEQVERRIASGEIEIAPIAFMRGRTLNDAFIILDEAQNTTPLQMKMFLTRFGMRSRMVICGDPQQVDLPDPSQVGPGRRGRQARAGQGHRGGPLHRRRRRAAPARRTHRRGL